MLIPGDNLLGVYLPEQIAEHGKPTEEARILETALSNPIGTATLAQLVNKGNKVVIVTSDLTRPCPSYKLLPPVIAELETAGIPNEDITIVLALGTHRRMTVAEIDQALSPEIRRRFNAINHDVNDTVRLGTTSRGTPVEFFRPVVEADVRICLGNLEYHYFAGFSGGAKAVMPGCASKAAVNANHAMMAQREAAAGRAEDNPLRLDLEEAVSMLGVDFILNVVLDREHNILNAVAGDVIEAHRAGCQMIAHRGRVNLPTSADIVLAGAGGFPKDINLYQAHKALENAKYAVRDGGIIILVAECREEIGHPVFRDWMLSASKPHDNLLKIRKEFILGGHKAAAMAAIQERASIYLVSAMPDEFVRRLFMEPFSSPQAAIDKAIAELGSESKVIVLPQAVSVLPAIANQA